ncbi:hypothetical protein BGZ80_002685, partial [Entomortierella chlamydospora]
MLHRVSPENKERDLGFLVRTCHAIGTQDVSVTSSLRLDANELYSVESLTKSFSFAKIRDSKVIEISLDEKSVTAAAAIDVIKGYSVDLKRGLS